MMFGALDIPASGMIAQRTRSEVYANNIANSESILNAKGEYEPYRQRLVHVAPGNPNAASSSSKGLGVHVAEIEIDTQTSLNKRHEPGSPYDFDGDGYVEYPNVNPVVEQMNLLNAGRAYEANVVAAEALKSMFEQTLRLIA